MICGEHVFTKDVDLDNHNCRGVLDTTKMKQCIDILRRKLNENSQIVPTTATINILTENLNGKLEIAPTAAPTVKSAMPPPPPISNFPQTKPFQNVLCVTLWYNVCILKMEFSKKN